MKVNVISIKWGDKFGPHYVNRLFSGVQRNLSYPFRFVCFTDNDTGLLPEIEAYPLPSVDSRVTAQFARGYKHGLFNSEIGNLEGTCLYFDLDVLIIDSIDCFFDYLPGKFCMCKEWLHPLQRLRHRFIGKQLSGNSSIFRFEANSMEHVVDAANCDSEKMRSFSLEQEWLSYIVRDTVNWWPDSWVSSFKHRHPKFPISLVVPPKQPIGSRVVVFNGPLNPHQAIEGNFDLSPRRICRPTSWVAKYWTD